MVDAEPVAPRGNRALGFIEVSWWSRIEECQGNQDHDVRVMDGFGLSISWPDQTESLLAISLGGYYPTGPCIRRLSFIMPAKARTQRVWRDVEG